MADLSLDYERIYFENEPSRKTPINARTLNILDEAIYRLYQILRYGGVSSGGRQIELRNNGEYIQWRYVGDDVWTNLASLEELKGAKGDDGNGIVSMEKTSSDGPVDTYTVTFTDGSTFEFRVTNGLSSISSQNGLMLNDGGRRKVKSMISFIDDDCRKETFDKLFPLIKNLGIPYSVACAPGSLDDAENVYMKSSDLQTMYNSGFSVISHHYKQDNMDNTEAYPNYDAYDSNLENCQKRFAELGINDVMAVSYPQGRIVDEYIPSVKKHYKMGFTIDRGINEIPYESFYMKRCELFPENGAYTYLDAQQLVNEVALNGGWLIFMTHAWYPSFNEGVLSDLITYIKGLNIDIVDVNDAIEMTGNIIEIGHVKKPLEERAYPYYIVDANGRTWTNSVNLLEANDRELKEIKPAYLYGAYMNISGNVRSHDDTNRTVSLPVDVVPGEIYYLTCSAIYEQAIYLFYTSDGSVVEGGYRQPETNTSEGIIGNTVLINHEVIVPEGAATMRVSSNWNIQPDGYKIVKVIYPEEKEKGKNNLYGYDTSAQVDEKIRNNFPTYYFSVTKNEDGSYSSDKSYDDINSAYNGSKNLICNYETTFLNISEIITLKLGLVRHTDFDSARIYEFNCIDNDKQYTVCITKDSDSGNTIVTFSEVELGTSFSGSAKDVTYDDTETQLGADDVQEAIGKLSEQKVNLPVDEDGELLTPTEGQTLLFRADGTTYYGTPSSTGGGGDSGGGDTGTTTHGIVWDLVNVTSSNAVTSVNDGASLVAVLTPSDGYTLGDVTVTMGGEVLTGVWNADTSTVTIASVTGDVIVSCSGMEITVETISLPFLGQNQSAISSTYTYDAWLETLGTSGQYSFFGGEITGKGTLVINADLTGFTGVPTATAFIYDNDGNFISATGGGSGLKFEQAEWLESTYYLPMENKEVHNLVVDNENARRIIFTMRRNGATTDTIDSNSSFATWGKENVTVSYQTGSSTEETVSVAQLVDDDYAMDYGVATTSLVTEIVGDTTTFEGVLETAKNEWMLAYGGDINKIPLIIHTDQHGHLNRSETIGDVFDKISEMVNWYDISKVINLGDTSNSYENPTDLTAGSTSLEKYLDAMSEVPFSKRIEIFGNHDAMYFDSATLTAIYHEQSYLNPYFRNIYARKTSNNGYFVIKDDYFNVKYVVISGFEFDENYGNQYVMSSEQHEWMIKELEKADGYDVIILSHVPLTGTAGTVDLSPIASARKSKTSGTITDRYGVVHSYDFSGCDGELICSLHGHEHVDGSGYYGSVPYATFQNFYASPRCLYFVLVDRANEQLNIWKVDSTPQYQNFQIPFNKPEE